MKKTTILRTATIISLLLFSCKIDDDAVPDNPNKHPIANAGIDQDISLPDNRVELDGSASLDPDGHINLYNWKKIAGADCFIESPGAPRTKVSRLSGGVYQFLLTVRDNRGSVSGDTVQVTVKNGVGTCDTKDRPQVNATLTEIGTLSFAVTPYVAAAGNKIFFAGTSHEFAVVDIYDINSHTWQRVALSEVRTNMAIVACGNKIFFAGGNRHDTWFDIVDIYDISDGSWTVGHLSEPKSELAAASIDDKVFFAGGIIEDGWNQTDGVDIYDISDDSWSYYNLGQSKVGISTVTAGNKVYFAGGWNYLSGMNPQKSVDIYNASTNSWSIDNLNFISGGISGVAKGDNIYWSGVSWPQYDGTAEVWNINNGAVTNSCLSYPRNCPCAISRHDDIIFFVPGSRVDNGILSEQFDIYNTVTGRWSLGLLNAPIASPGIISVNNVVYLAGGKTSNGYTNKVYTLNW